jgi:hypothetical protein
MSGHDSVRADRGRRCCCGAGLHPALTFADRLRQLRRDRGLSLRQLQQTTHHSKTLVWEWENVMVDLGVGEADLTTELYTDAVRAARQV